MSYKKAEQQQKLRSQYVHLIKNTVCLFNNISDKQRKLDNFKQTNEIKDVKQFHTFVNICILRILYKNINLSFFDDDYKYNDNDITKMKKYIFNLSKLFKYYHKIRKIFIAFIECKYGNSPNNLNRLHQNTASDYLEDIGPIRIDEINLPDFSKWSEYKRKRIKHNQKKIN